jgi:peptidoglycan/xylan/chitin deacetylase (PgdA/CDA1 family)
MGSWFGERGIKASFFIVGRDLAVARKAAQARLLATDGHEIGNHSFTHTIGITRLPTGRLREEIAKTHEAILAAGLPAPVGFRAPGYDVDARVLRELRKIGYRYDASVLPTALGPVMRLADAWLARRWDPSKKQFGRMSYVRAPRVPYFPDPYKVRTQAHGDSGLVEFPVTTLPPWGLPLTGAGIFALGPYRVIEALKKLEAESRPILLLLHGIDFVDCDKPLVFAQRTPSTGGFDLSAREKLALIKPVMDWIQRRWEITRARDWGARYWGG